MPLVVTGEAQHKMSGARSCIALQPFCQGAVWAGIASLPAAHHGSGLAIILFKITVEPFVGTVAILVGNHRQIHSAGQRVRITPRRACDFLDIVPQASPLVSIRRDRQPAVEEATGAIEARGQRSTNPDRGPTLTIWCRAKDAVLDFPPAIPIDRFPAPQRTGEPQTFE